MRELDWPERWQPEAIAAAAPYVGTERRLDMWFGTPASVSGTRYTGHVYVGEDGRSLTLIHDRSGRTDVYPWRLSIGPVLLIKLLRPRRPGLELYRHPGWPKSATHP